MSEKDRKRRRQNRERRKRADRPRWPAVGQPAAVDTPSPGFQETTGNAPSDGPHVVVAIASMGQIHEQTLASIQAMIQATCKAASLEMWWRNAYPGGRCRNLLVERFLADKRKTHLLFVDTDMEVPAHGLDLLLETNRPLVCGPAPVCIPRKGTPPPGASGYRLTSNIGDIKDSALRGTPTDPGDPTIQYTWREYGELPDTLFTCDVTGMSFCLIAREVLEQMTPPWFCFLDLPDRTEIGLDVYFFRKASQLGYRVAVNPELWCDHVKLSDLTHIEHLLGHRVPAPAWNWKPSGPPPRTMVIACTTRHWLDIETAECLLRWQDRWGDRVGVHLVEAGEAGWALARALHDPAVRDPQWERLLLVGPDMVPTEELLPRLGSIDAPVVSTINRGLVDGKLAYTFAQRDPLTGRVEYPTSLALSACSAPFEAETVDLSCSVISSDTCQHAPEALRYAVDQPDPVRAFSERFVELVRQQSGRNPVVAPVAVRRRANLGLLGLIKLKHEMQTKEQRLAAEPQAVLM